MTTSITLASQVSAGHQVLVETSLCLIVKYVIYSITVVIVIGNLYRDHFNLGFSGFFISIYVKVLLNTLNNLDMSFIFCIFVQDLKLEVMWKEKWKSESKISQYEFFMLKNIPNGCKSSVKKELNNLKLKYNDLYGVV